MKENHEPFGRLPHIDEITEEMILSLRHPDWWKVCRKEKECENCKDGQGSLIGRKYVELYSIHYIDSVDVYGCENCGSIWWEHVSTELA